MTRQQIFQLVGVRPVTSQRVRLGAKRDGRMVALGHDVTMHTSPLAEYAEQTATAARPMYAAPNRLTRHRLDGARPAARRRRPRAGRGAGPAGVRVGDRRAGRGARDGSDRVPHPATSRPVHPETGQPFSDRRLVECMREGARRFGWERRPARPGQPEGRPLAGRLRRWRPPCACSSSCRARPVCG